MHILHIVFAVLTGNFMLDVYQLVVVIWCFELLNDRKLIRDFYYYRERFGCGQRYKIVSKSAHEVIHLGNRCNLLEYRGKFARQMTEARLTVVSTYLICREESADGEFIGQESAKLVLFE